MTKDEAVKYLIQPFCTSTVESEEYRKQREAYTMAIESLKTEAIPVEWIEQYMEAIHTGDIFTDGIVRIHVENMVDDWQKEQRKEE